MCIISIQHSYKMSIVWIFIPNNHRKLSLIFIFAYTINFAFSFDKLFEAFHRFPSHYRIQRNPHNDIVNVWKRQKSAPISLISFRAFGWRLSHINSNFESCRRFLQGSYFDASFTGLLEIYRLKRMAQFCLLYRLAVFSHLENCRELDCVKCFTLIKSCLLLEKLPGHYFIFFCKVSESSMKCTNNLFTTTSAILILQKGKG